MKKRNELTSWMVAKKNYPYIILLVVGLIIGTYKYSFTAAILGFLLVVFIGFIAGFVINKLIK